MHQFPHEEGRAEQGRGRAQRAEKAGHRAPKGRTTGQSAERAESTEGRAGAARKSTKDLKISGDVTLS